MPVFHIIQSPVIGIWEITETWQVMLELFTDKTLFADDVRQIQSDKRKCEWLAIRLLLKNLTGTEMRISYKDNGAPFLENNPFHISISHTKGYAALMLSQYPKPGIDIEYPSDRAWKLRTKFLSTDEQGQLCLFEHHALIDAEAHSTTAALATICWCAKETAFKAMQVNGVDFIKHLHITPFTVADKGIILLKETKTPKQEIFPIHYQTTDDFIFTWKE